MMDAATKLEQEIKNPGKLSRIEAAMLEPVGRMLTSFCEQDARFAETVFEKKETLTDCMHAVSKGVTYALSDVEAYKRAAYCVGDKFYSCRLLGAGSSGGTMYDGRLDELQTEEEYLVEIKKRKERDKTDG